MISRALVEIFGDDRLAEALAFGGGTALYKLHLTPGPRYSEDIDLVQKTAEPIGPTIDHLRARLDSWLGAPKRSFNEGRVALVYRFPSEDPAPLHLRLKVEINSREHFTVLGFECKELTIRSRWFSGSSRVSTYALDELLGTKLRALYQRKKGRDLFDLWWASSRAKVDLDRVVRCFGEYLAADGLRVSRAETGSESSCEAEGSQVRRRPSTSPGSRDRVGSRHCVRLGLSGAHASPRRRPLEGGNGSNRRRRRLRCKRGLQGPVPSRFDRPSRACLARPRTRRQLIGCHWHRGRPGDRSPSYRPSLRRRLAPVDHASGWSGCSMRSRATRFRTSNASATTGAISAPDERLRLSKPTNCSPPPALSTVASG